MINQIYQLVQPKVISVEYTDLSFENKVIVKPEYMAICHADQRYYFGQRDIGALKEKLPMALIHECCGRILYDPTNTFSAGQRVVMIPNVSPREDTVIYENYRKESYFLSSGHDGFMRELVDLDVSRMIPCDEIPATVAAITEFVSVGEHAVTRFQKAAHSRRNRIGIWGDGSLAYVVACVLKARVPDAELVVIGREPRKLSAFSFVEETYFADSIPENLAIDHAFECCGGEGSYYAIEDVIHHINPQGTLMLLGVSENRCAIDTRMVLEKGMTLIGCSRSGREDFLQAIELMKNDYFQQLLKVIIYEDAPVRSITDIHRVFSTDVTTPFKTVFHWEV